MTAVREIFHVIPIQGRHDNRISNQAEAGSRGGNQPSSTGSAEDGFCDGVHLDQSLEGVLENGEGRQP